MFRPTTRAKLLAKESYLKNFEADDGKVVKTKKDKQLDATFDLHEDADRLDDAIALMEECLDNLCDPNTSKKDKAYSRKFVLKTILPALGHMSSHLRSAATQLSPIPAVSYAHRRESTKQKNEAKVAASRSNEPIEAILLKDFIKKNEEEDSQCKSKAVTPPKKTPLTRSATKKLPLTITPPEPADGKQYTKTEFCKIVTQYTKRSNERATMFNKIIEKKYVTYNPASLYKLIRQYEAFGPGEGFIADRMRGPGAPPILEDDELLKSIEEFEDHNGQVMKAGGRMKKALVDSKRRKLENAGYCAVGEHVGVSRQTSVNYLAWCAGKTGTHITDSAISKTVARFASEGSFRCVLGNIVLGLDTQFVEIEEEDPKIRELAKLLSPEDRQMYDLASDVRGGRPVRPLPARNVVNRDDKVFFAKPGSKEEEPQGVMLCTTSSLQKRGHASLSEVKDEKKMSGIRTKVHACLNGEGDSAAQCLTFALNEREMPHDDIIIWEIEGLCIGGNACNNVGYVIFLRKSPGAELKRFNFIENKIHLPFVKEKCRSKECPECPTVSSCDGDMSQIKCITGTNMTNLYEENNITCVKHNASNTGNEQSCDKGKVFPTIEQEYKKLTEADLPGSDCVMKKRIDDKFDECRSRLSVSSARRKVMTDVLCCWPDVATKAFSKKKAQKGFFLNGTLDEKNKLFPSWHGILGTCKRKIPTAVIDLFMDNIQLLFNTMQKLGHIPEEMWDEIGIPKDVCPDGTVFERNAGISQEPQQRTKILNHHWQIKQREKRREEIDEAVRQKKLRAKNKLNANIAGDVATVQKLLQLLKARDETAEQNLANCTKGDFFCINAPELRNFILHRSTDKKYDTKTKLNKVKKGTLAEANEEVEGAEDNQLVSIAFELRSEVCKLEDANSPDEATDDTTLSADIEPTVMRIVMDPTAEWQSPAVILSNAVWIGNVNRIFNSFDSQALLVVDEQAKIRAVSLAHALFRRFEHHVNKRIQVESKRSHPILKWFRRNIPAFAAYMVLFDHVKKNPSSLSDMDCLLTNSMNKFLLLNSNNPDLWGAYLVYDSSEEKHVRSGKCTGRGMEKRWDEHRKNALSDTNANDSKFVDVYPSKHSTRASSASGRCFEHLNQYAAAAFKPADATFDLFQKDYDSGGLFSWTEAERDLVRRTKIRGDGDMHKFAAVVAYGFELCYDLAISPRDNLSESPGFEAFGLMFGGW